MEKNLSLWYEQPASKWEITRQYYKGGQEIVYECKLDRIPVFVMEDFEKKFSYSSEGDKSFKSEIKYTVIDEE